MSGTAGLLSSVGQSDRAMLAMAPRESTSTPRRILTAHQLMARECGILLPRLDEIPAEHRFLADDKETIALAEILVNSDIAVAEDWEKSGKDETKYLLLTLERWIRDHGGAAVDRRFDLELTLSDRLVDYSDERGPQDTLYLIVDPGGAAFVLLNPVLELLTKIHPRLPATFFRHFVGSLNRWVRVYDYRDAEERVDMLREWYEGEENSEQYEVPDIERCTPRCLKEASLSLRSLRDLVQTIRSRDVKVLVTALLELRAIARRATRPEFTEDMGDQLTDSNPPLPCLLAAFARGDAVVGCFDDEAQTAMETTPDPNLIIPLKLSDPGSVCRGFRTLGVACETLAAASRLIDLMPGNGDGVITREEQS
jgi:hypothetical protein